MSTTMRVYSAPVLAAVMLMRDVLEARGITTEIRGEDRAAAGAGPIPGAEAWAELWVLEEAQLAEARRVVEEALTSPAVADASWQCRQCGEEVDGEFAECWNCGTPRERGPGT